MWCVQLPHSLATIRTSLPWWTIPMNHLSPFFLDFLLPAIYHTKERVTNTDMVSGKGMLVQLLRSTRIPFSNSSQNRESAYCLRSQKPNLQHLLYLWLVLYPFSVLLFETQILIKGRLTVVESDLNKGMQASVLYVVSHHQHMYITLHWGESGGQLLDLNQEVSHKIFDVHFSLEDLLCRS